MVKKKDYFIERTEGDDILDALSLRVNQVLKTEKKIDDKKNNIYFWLFKFILLLIFLLFVNSIFSVLKEAGIIFIYYFCVSLRGPLSSIWGGVVDFSRGLLIIYILFKNLKIFMESSYYKRLYSSDKEMNRKKKKFFGTVSTVLKCLSVPFLVFVSFIAAVLLSVLTMLIYLSINGVYSVSTILIILCLTSICYSVFKNIQNRFFNVGTAVGKRSFVVTFVLLLFSIVLFSYEIGSYEYSDTLPYNFVLKEEIMYFDISTKKDVIINTTSKYDNTNLYIDNTLEGKIRVEFEYFETADIKYTYYFNEENDLRLSFDSSLNFGVEDFEDVLKLGVESLRNQTLYNYNLFKYPTINIYVNNDDASRITLLDYRNNEKDELD